MARELKGSSVTPDLHWGEPGTFESEYLRKAGRIDALRIDENSSPAVIEYKRAINRRCRQPEPILSRMAPRP